MIQRLVVVAFLLGACAGGDSGGGSDVASELNIVAVDFGFELDTDVLAAGDVSTTLTNNGEEPHQAGYFKLNAGVTYEEFVAAILKDDTQIPQLATGGRAGVVRSVSPGDSYERPGDDLEPGSYAIMCSIRDPKTGKNHYELGMVAPITVR